LVNANIELELNPLPSPPPIAISLSSLIHHPYSIPAPFISWPNSLYGVLTQRRRQNILENTHIFFGGINSADVETIFGPFATL
jgi:hypothetical protein